MTPSEFRIVRALSRHALRASAKLALDDEAARAVRHYVFRLQVELAGEADDAAHRVQCIHALSEWYDQRKERT